MQNISGVAAPSQSPQLHFRQTKLVCQHLISLRFFPVCNIFPIIGQYKVIFTSWAVWVFILSKNKKFQSTALLKMPSSHLLS